MKLKKITAVLAGAALVACLGMFGCSSGSASSSSSSSSSAATEEISVLNDGKLTILTSPDYPPFENVEDGEVVGFEIDLFKAIAQELDLEFEPVQMQFDAIIPAVVAGGQGDVGVSGISITPERGKEVDFTTAFYVDNQGVAVMKDSGITEDNVESKLNAEGVKIAVQTGTTGEDFVKEHFPKATPSGYGNSTDCFAAMQAGQADAVCTNLSVVDRMIANGYSDAQVVYQQATGEEYAAVVSKDNPQLLEAINKAIATLQENGTITELENKWFS